MDKRHKNIPIFVPHIGCPNDCSFCNQKKITGVKDAPNADDVRKIIDDALSAMEENQSAQVAFFGGSFTGIEKSYRRELLSVAASYLEKGLISGIRLSTRPDYIDDEILNELMSFGVTDIELGVQSMDDEVLFKNRRGHTSEQTRVAAKKIKEYNYRLGLQMMPGLFGDNPEKIFYTAKEIIKLSPDCVRIYPTVVIRDTFLDELYKKGEFVPLSIDEAVMICAELTPLFKEKNIKIIRMGLMATDILSGDGEVVAGPYHPSFGELVLSEILYNKAKQMLCGIDGDVRFCINPKTVSAFIGNKKKNINRLKEEFCTNIYICTDEKIPRNEVRIDVS